MSSRYAPSSLDPEAFRKVLKLEEAKGFKDTAVVGGLDRFLERHQEPLSAMASKDDGSPGLARMSYGAMTLAQRKSWVDRWLSWVEAPSSDVGRLGETPATKAAPPRAGPPAASSPNAPLPAESPRKRRGSPLGLSLDSPVDRLRGVDARTSARLLKLGVSSIRDLLYLLPRRHNDFSQVVPIAELVPGQEQTTIATVWEAREVSLRRGKLKSTEAVVGDETGNMQVVWFGQPYVARALKPNTRLALSGRVDVYQGRVQLQSPEFEVLDRNEGQVHTGRLVPVYPLTQGLSPRRLRSILWQALEEWLPGMEEYLPQSVMVSLGVMDLPKAIMQAHYPDDSASAEAARRRLAFDELFLLQLAVLIRRRTWQSSALGVPIHPSPEVQKGFLASLPFALTGAQERCIGEVLSDMERGIPPMNRLLQGEVGSGKTVVALSALLEAVAGGYQGSIMVPTELLADQHFATVASLLGGLAGAVHEEGRITVPVEPLSRPLSVGILTGSTRAASKREIQRRLADGSLDILIGTHALIQEGVEIPRLALAVVDEQHRFGVQQRAALRERMRGTDAVATVEGEPSMPAGSSPHLLVMSATPIPRTLALTLYGDLDISTIDELPLGRQRVLTRVVPTDRRDAAYGFVRNQVAEGRQAYVICPLVEESEAVEARAATEEYQRLSAHVFPDLRLGLLHGRMSAREKEEVMGGFRQGEIDVLVSTAVVEVGIDVPNATVMMVEGAHRFGLSQLHQFRGRVGRGAAKSYCLLLPEYSTPEARQRLAAMERIHDGFRLAEVDLEMRGPGDYFGTRQSGLPTFRVARLTDQDLLRTAREQAQALLEEDPDLGAPGHGPLATEVARMLQGVMAEAS